MEKQPLTLYKYIRWSDKPRDKIKDIIRKNIFYFANPLMFNDPFDSKIPILFEQEYRSSRKFHEDFLRINNTIGKTAYTEEQIQEKADDYFAHPHTHRYNTNIMTESIHQVINDRFRISCFSTKRNNILLWSHYADSHKGICIGFRTLFFLLAPELVILKKVEYAKRFPKFSQVTGLPIVTTKSTVWSYEK